jgi:hypothetical protein
MVSQWFPNTKTKCFCFVEMKTKTRRIKRQRGGVTFSNTVPVRAYNKTARAVMNANIGIEENNALPYMNIGSKPLKPESANSQFSTRKNEAAILARMKQRMSYPYAAENAHAAAEYAYYSNNVQFADRDLAKSLRLRNLNPLENAEYRGILKQIPAQGFRETIQKTATSNNLPKTSKNAIVGYLRASKIVRNAEKMVH